MVSYKKFIIAFSIFTVTLLSFMVLTENHSNKSNVITLSEYIEDMDYKTSSVKMYESIEKYSTKYSIPKHIIYNIAFMETKYHGPFDWKYKHNLGSYAGALGPMQIMPSTAKLIHKKKVSKNKLKNDIDYNVKTSAILLKKLYRIYKDWGKVCGAYNTGKPIVNSYSKFCIENIKYWKNWYYFSRVD